MTIATSDLASEITEIPLTPLGQKPRENDELQIPPTPPKRPRRVLIELSPDEITLLSIPLLEGLPSSCQNQQESLKLSIRQRSMGDIYGNIGVREEGAGFLPLEESQPKKPRLAGANSNDTLSLPYLSASLSSIAIRKPHLPERSFHRSKSWGYARCA